MEETGLKVSTTKLLGVDSLETDGIDEGVKYHSVRLIYEAEYVSGELTFEQDGTTEKCEWHPLSNIADLLKVGLVDAGLDMFRQQQGA